MADSEVAQAIRAIINSIAQEHGVDPALAIAVAEKESSLNPNAVGDGGKAIGLFQLHGGAAKDAGITNRSDLFENIIGGVRYLGQLVKRYGGDTSKALMAYNGGLGNVDKGTVSEAARSYATDVIGRMPRQEASPALVRRQDVAEPTMAAEQAPVAQEARSLPGVGTESFQWPGPSISRLEAPPAAQPTRPSLFRLSNGQKVRMPPDWSDDQVADVLAQMESEGAAPPKQDDGPASRFLSNYGSGLNPINMVKGAAQAVMHPYDTFIAPADRNLGKIPSALREGRFTDALNAGAASIPIIGPASEGWSEQMKSGDVAGALGGMAAFATAPRVYGAVGSGLKRVGVTGAGTVLDAPPAVREIALRERALPGLLRGGTTRATARSNSAAGQVRSAIEPIASHPVSAQTIRYAPDAWDAIQARLNAAPGVRAARKVNSQPPPATAGKAFDAAEGSFQATAGKSDPASVMERAMATNALEAIGDVAPNAQRSLRRYGDIQQVLEAYKRSQPDLPPGMAPTMSLRLLAAAGHRLAGPLSQGVFNTGRMISGASNPAIMRALVLEGLLTDEPQK